MKKGCLIGIVVILIMGLIGSCLPDEPATDPTIPSSTASETITTTQETVIIEPTEQTENTPPTEEASVPTTTPPTTSPATEPAEEMVWIPKSGSKYHQNSWCSNMKNPREVTLKYAKKHGYTACKRCH